MPGLLIGAIAVLLLIHALRGWLAETRDLDLLIDLSFIPAPWSVSLGFASAEEVIRAAAGDGIADPQLSAARVGLAHYVTTEIGAHPWSVLTYALLHGSWLHVVMNCVWLAAFGTPVMRRAGNARTLVLAVATAIGGAAAQWISGPLSVQPMIGVSAVVSGLMAAAATFVFARRSGPSAWMAGSYPVTRKHPDWSFLRNRSALVFLASWFGLNLVFGILAVPLGLSEGGIAWQGHIGGLLVGLILFPFLDPGPKPGEMQPYGT